jgi:integrase
MFRTLAARAGLSQRSPQCRPTIHGLRHTFAVNTMIRWYREGADVRARLPVLSTWLGHADPKWTYWYLSASPDLLALAGERLEASMGELP